MELVYRKSLYAYTGHKEVNRENKIMSYTEWRHYPEKRKAGERSSLHSQKNGMVLPKKRDDIPGDLLHDYSGIYGWGEHNRK